MMPGVWAMEGGELLEWMSHIFCLWVQASTWQHARTQVEVGQRRSSAHVSGQRRPTKRAGNDDATE